MYVSTHKYYAEKECHVSTYVWLVCVVVDWVIGVYGNDSTYGDVWINFSGMQMISLRIDSNKDYVEIFN